MYSLPKVSDTPRTWIHLQRNHVSIGYVIVKLIPPRPVIDTRIWSASYPLSPTNRDAFYFLIDACNVHIIKTVLIQATAGPTKIQEFLKELLRKSVILFQRHPQALRHVTIVAWPYF